MQWADSDLVSTCNDHRLSAAVFCDRLSSFMEPIFPSARRLCEPGLLCWEWHVGRELDLHRILRAGG